MSNVFRGVEGTVPAELAALHVDDLARERDQARGLACEYASRLARITELLQAIADGRGSVVGSDEAYPELLRARSLAQAALAVASGAAVEVPLRVLVEWALRGRGWSEKRDFEWSHPERYEGSSMTLDSAVADEIEREEAAPAAEAST
jgi:hypothetical protein